MITAKDISKYVDVVKVVNDIKNYKENEYNPDSYVGYDSSGKMIVCRDNGIVRFIDKDTNNMVLFGRVLQDIGFRPVSIYVNGKRVIYDYVSMSECTTV